MSAFFVGKDTIDATVTAFIRAGNLMSLESASALGRRLLCLNAVSLQARYGEDPKRYADGIAAYTWTPRPEDNTTLLKSLHCFLYQSCEGYTDETELWHQIDAVSRKTPFVGLEDTPQYEAAPWGLFMVLV